MHRVALAAFALLWVVGCLGPAGHPVAGKPLAPAQPSASSSPSSTAPAVPDLPDRLPILRVSGLFQPKGPPYNGSTVACTAALALAFLNASTHDLWFPAGRLNRSAAMLVWDTVEVDSPGESGCGPSGILWRHDVWPARVEFRNVSVEVGDASGGLLLNGTFLAEGDTLTVPLAWTSRYGGNDYAYEGNLTFRPLGAWTRSGLHPYDDWSQVPQGNLTSAQDIRP